MVKKAEDGGVDWDQVIGSLLERWLTTPCKGQCRFCRKTLDNPEVEPEAQFCSAECRRAWEEVKAARIAIGLRDLRQRGYD